MSTMAIKQESDVLVASMPRPIFMRGANEMLSDQQQVVHAKAYIGSRISYFNYREHSYR